MLWTPPGADYGLGEDAVAWCESVGMRLDPWQAWSLRMLLGERPADEDDGEGPPLRWAAGTAGLIVPRQNGKGTVLEAREAVALYLLGDELVVHSAHEASTAGKHFARLRRLFESHRDLRKQLLPGDPSRSFRFANGEQAIRLRNGSAIEFRTRTKSGGRGFSGDLVVFDEAMYAPAAQVNALRPTMAARPNPQLIYAASAVDVSEHPDGLTLTRVRNRALAGDDPSLAYLEWSAPGDDPEAFDVHDDEALAAANPALGYRLSWSGIDDERSDMTRRGFAVERAGVGAWPVEQQAAGGVLDFDRWQTLAIAPEEPLTDPVCIGVDTNPLRSSTTITVAGWTPQRRACVEVVDRRSGTGWVVERLLGLVARWDPCAIVLDSKGPAAALLPELRKAGIEPAVTTYAELVEACSGWVDKLNDGVLGHREDPRLDDAVRTAQRRGTSDQMLFARAKGGEDITPLVGGALAVWGLECFGDPPPAPGLPGVDLLDDQAPERALAGATDLATIGF